MPAAAYIGLMSGTSMDGVDAVVARFKHDTLTLVCTTKFDYPDELRASLRRAATSPAQTGIDEIGELDTWVGECFRDAVIELLAAASLESKDIRAIGSHGQTIRHRPDATHRFTMQIGNPSVIATATGIDTIADFRRSDMALDGQGAPLTPPFHRWLFHSGEEDRLVLNLGGIGNVTVLPATGAAVTGFDTGPANTLLDAWIHRHHGDAMDDDGTWARGGRMNRQLLQHMLADPWFVAAPPKSTGIELFNSDWLEKFDVNAVPAQDVQTTLVELTATSVANAIDSWAPATSRIFACGGGVHNGFLMERLAAQLEPRVLDSTTADGLAPDWVEAAAFAWLAMQHIEGRTGNLPAVTGARREAILGAMYRA